MRSARIDDVAPLNPAQGPAAPRAIEGEAVAGSVLSPFKMDPYYQDAFCVLLEGGMRTCCG